ncbi:DUF1206 domain-containing protein [Lysobacter sp. A3-1-A15]|uniref:DUF1206 domain-containing protein n=1 Tax=Novilysobacter viscosus TaxID=3098602 RepID=UPI002ED77C64
MDTSIGGNGRAALNEVASWVPPVARIGYAAKGIVYGLVGGIAVKAGLAAGGPSGTQESLASLTDEQGGRIMLMAIAVGLLCHVAWRFVQALLDPEHVDSGAKRVAMRLFYALSGVIYASLAVTAWQLSRGEGAGGDGQQVWVARLLDQPMGAWLVMAAGLGVAGYGIHQLVKAAKGDVNKRMGASGGHTSRGLTLVGRIGTAARGLVLLPVGWFTFRAGRLYSAEAAADTGEVLHMLGGGTLLALVGLGLLAYGVHQFAKAIYRRIEQPG